MFKKMIKRIIPVGIVIAAVVAATLMVASREKLSSADVAQPLPQVRAMILSWAMCRLLSSLMAL